ncbi:MAG: GNAT family N-acetyltransferase, partial [Planctomycetota bacterium]
MALLSKNHRKRCRKWNRQYFESGEIKMHSTLQQWDHDSAFATLVELHSQRRNAVGEQSFFDCPRQSQFLRAAFDALSKEGLVEISGIELHGEMIAVEFELLGNDTVYAYQSGIRESAKEYSPGSLSLLWRIRHAIESGKTTFDFMRGTEEYKSHWKAKTNTTSLIHLR